MSLILLLICDIMIFKLRRGFGIGKRKGKCEMDALIELKESTKDNIDKVLALRTS